MSDPKALKIGDFDYSLPDDRIAKFPLEERDASKLLVYKSGNIEESTYRHLADFLPRESALVFNNTRVVQARMHFVNANGKTIELFCLEPSAQFADLAIAMSAVNEVEWICLVGGAKKWKTPTLTCTFEHAGKTIQLMARQLERLDRTFRIQFQWDAPNMTFAELLDVAGVTPLPPYLKRDAEAVDKARYQTIYAEHNGSVAAPTAGLHFTKRVFRALEEKRIDQLFVTLHVGAGTFKPVQSETIEGHDMHFEFIHVQRLAIQELLKRKQNNQPIVAVGTTSMRTLESLYWLGCKALKTPDVKPEQFQVLQWDPYDGSDKSYTVVQALEALLEWLKRNNLNELMTKTQLMIAPGYTLRLIDGLITNFHQPKSTLILLVAAIIGNDWKRIYQHALANDFRFLSYGDGSLLWRGRLVG